MSNILALTGHKLEIPNIIKGNNCRLLDSNGKEYLDLESGIWCTAIGHSHPRITNILSSQAADLMHSGYCYLHPVTEEACTQILSITGHPKGKCLILNSGSEAVELMITAIKKINPRPFLVKLTNTYLGAYGSASGSNQDEWITFNWKSPEELETLPYDQISGLILEPGSACGHVHFPPKEIIQKLVRRIRQSGGLIGVNEITTGIGRTGTWFGFQHYDFSPDFVAMGKGLGNGYPVSAVTMTAKAATNLISTGFHYAQSHQNSPLGAAVALEVIKIIKEQNLLVRCKTIGTELRNQLEKLKSTYPVIQEIRGRGLMAAIEFKPNHSSIASRIQQDLFSQGIILVKRSGAEILRLDPALTIPSDDLKLFLTCLENSLKKIF